MSKGQILGTSLGHSFGHRFEARQIRRPSSTDRRRKIDGGAPARVYLPDELRGLAAGEPRAGETPRPRTRGECPAERPCPFASCRYHLGVDVLDRLPNGDPTDDGALRKTWPHREVWEGPETCALDVADRGPQTLLQVGLVTNLTREGVRRIEQHALAKLRGALGDQADALLALLTPDTHHAPSSAPTFARRVDDEDDSDLDLEVIDLSSDRADLIAAELGATRCPGCGALHMRLAAYCSDPCAVRSRQARRRRGEAELRRRAELKVLEASEVLGDRIRWERLRRKMSVVEAARLAGVAKSTWANWEASRRVPATWQAMAVAHALRVPSLADAILAAARHPIERLAARRGWSLRELSRRASVARDTLTAAVTGRRAPSTTTLRKLEQVLGAEISGAKR